MSPTAASREESSANRPVEAARSIFSSVGILPILLVVALTLVAVDIFSFLAASTLRAIPQMAFAADSQILADRVADLILHGALVRESGPAATQPPPNGVSA